MKNKVSITFGIALYALGCIGGLIDTFLTFLSWGAKSPLIISLIPYCLATAGGALFLFGLVRTTFPRIKARIHKNRIHSLNTIIYPAIALLLLFTFTNFGTMSGIYKWKDRKYYNTSQSTFEYVGKIVNESGQKIPNAEVTYQYSATRNRLKTFFSFSSKGIYTKTKNIKSDKDGLIHINITAHELIITDVKANTGSWLRPQHHSSTSYGYSLYYSGSRLHNRFNFHNNPAILVIARPSTPIKAWPSYGGNRRGNQPTIPRNPSITLLVTNEGITHFDHPNPTPYHPYRPGWHKANKQGNPTRIRSSDEIDIMLKELSAKYGVAAEIR